MTTSTIDRVPSAAAPDIEDDTIEAMDPARVLADDAGVAALAAMVARLRALKYDGSPLAEAPSTDPGATTLVDLGRGEAVRLDAVREAIGDEDVAVLRRCGALLVVGEEAALSAKIFPMRSVYTLLPHHQLGCDIVYLGQDSVCLFELVWAARGYGDHAVDLGTGNGFIAAALATRFDHVVAADVSSRCVSTAALIPALNPHLRGRFTAMQMDVANGLRPGAFDLVTANAPWVPETEGPDGTGPRVFAAGGPTGFELPKRFLDGACELLKPGGRAFIACSDIRFGDGRQPLMDHLSAIERGGFAVAAVETRMNELNDFDEWAARKAPGAVSARHLVVELHRPR